jgi:hypothetical protein
MVAQLQACGRHKVTAVGRPNQSNHLVRRGGALTSGREQAELGIHRGAIALQAEAENQHKVELTPGAGRGRRAILLGGAVWSGRSSGCLGQGRSPQGGHWLKGVGTPQARRRSQGFDKGHGLFLPVH